MPCISSTIKLTLCRALVLTLLLAISGQTLFAQSSRSKKKSSKSKSKNQLSKDEIQTMETQTEKLKEDFVSQMATLATDYAKGGEYEKSKAILNQLKRMSPGMPGIRAKIDQLDNALLSGNEAEFDLKVTSGWGVPLALVTKGKRFRIQAVGKYKFVSSATLGPAGFPNSKPPQIGLVADIPCGALMGIVVEKGKKPGKPFYVGLGKEISPRNSGFLFLKLNTPPGSKSSGKLKVQLSGGIQHAGKK